MAVTLDSVKNAIPVNWELLRNPVNWIIVFLMVAIAGAAVAVIFVSTSAQSENSNG